MAGGEKPTHEEILDLTPEQWERHKWQEDRDARHRELTLKEREDRRAFWANPLLLSIMGAIIAFIVNAANDTWTKSRNLAQAATESESSLIQKAMDQDEPAKVIARLRLLDAAGMIPRHRDQVRVLWTDEAAAQLFLSALSGGKATLEATADDHPTEPCDKAVATGKNGWLYLGRAGKTEWVPAEMGSDLIKWEVPVQPGAGYLPKSVGQCLRVARPKFLRDDGPPGQKLHAPIKMPVGPSSRLRVIALDDGGPEKAKEPNPPVWAHVEILAN